MIGLKTQNKACPMDNLGFKYFIIIYWWILNKPPNNKYEITIIAILGEVRLSETSMNQHKYSRVLLWRGPIYHGCTYATVMRAAERKLDLTLQWRHNEHNGVSNHQPHIVYSTVYSRCRSKNKSKLHVTGFCEGNSPVTSEFPAQRTSYTENVFIWWRHHENQKTPHVLSWRVSYGVSIVRIWEKIDLSYNSTALYGANVDKWRTISKVMPYKR